MNRRETSFALAALGASAFGVPSGALAQQPAPGTHRIGFLGPTSMKAAAGRWPALIAGLRELGYVEGKNLVIEARWAEGKYERLSGLAAELAHLNVAVIVTHTSTAAIAARQAAASTPVVFAALGDAQASGIVTSLARPGGNMTGLSIFSPEVSAKRLELAVEAMPKTARIGFLANRNNLSLKPAVIQAMEGTAASLKVSVQRSEVGAVGDFEGAMSAMARQGVTTVTIEDDPLLVGNSAALASLAARHRMATIGAAEVADAGCLLGFGADFPALFRRAATFVDRILKGARPGDLPIERADKFELVINQKTAKALGIRTPQGMLLRANRILE